MICTRPRSAQKALELNPYDTTLRMNLADTDFYGGRLQESLDRLLELDPLHAGAHAMRGRVFAYQGRCEEAREALERARELDVTTANAKPFCERSSWQEKQRREISICWR